MKKFLAFILTITLAITSLTKTVCFAEKKTTSNHTEQLYVNKILNSEAKQNVKRNYKSKLSEIFRKIKVALYLTSTMALAGGLYFLKYKIFKNDEVTFLIPETNTGNNDVKDVSDKGNSFLTSAEFENCEHVQKSNDNQNIKQDSIKEHSEDLTKLNKQTEDKSFIPEFAEEVNISKLNNKKELTLTKNKVTDLANYPLATISPKPKMRRKPTPTSTSTKNEVTELTDCQIKEQSFMAEDLNSTDENLINDDNVTLIPVNNTVGNETETINVKENNSSTGNETTNEPTDLANYPLATVSPKPKIRQTPTPTPIFKSTKRRELSPFSIMLLGSGATIGAFGVCELGGLLALRLENGVLTRNDFKEAFEGLGKMSLIYLIFVTPIATWLIMGTTGCLINVAGSFLLVLTTGCILDYNKKIG